MLATQMIRQIAQGQRMQGAALNILRKPLAGFLGDTRLNAKYRLGLGKRDVRSRPAYRALEVCQHLLESLETAQSLFV